MTAGGAAVALRARTPRSVRRQSHPALPSPGQGWGLWGSQALCGGSLGVTVCVQAHPQWAPSPQHRSSAAAPKHAAAAAALRVSRCKTPCWQAKISRCLPAGALSPGLPQPPGGRAGTAGRLAGLGAFPWQGPTEQIALPSCAALGGVQPPQGPSRDSGTGLTGRQVAVSRVTPALHDPGPAAPAPTPQPPGARGEGRGLQGALPVQVSSASHRPSRVGDSVSKLTQVRATPTTHRSDHRAEMIPLLPPAPRSAVPIL